MQTPALTPFYRRRGIAVTRAAHTFWRRRLAGWLVEGWLRGQTVLLYIFLYAPIAILVIFSFNKGSVPTFPLSGFTLHWYHQFLTNSDMQAALETSAIVAAVSSVIAVGLGILASIGLSRSRFRGKGFVTTLVLVPQALATAVSPAFATLFGAREHERIRSGYGRSLRLSHATPIPSSCRGCASFWSTSSSSTSLRA